MIDQSQNKSVLDFYRSAYNNQYAELIPPKNFSINAITYLPYLSVNLAS